MSNQELLMKFFTAENERDWETYRKFLHPDIKWVLHSKEVKTVQGIEAYLSTMIAAYQGNRDTFVCEKAYQGMTGNRIVTILINNVGERSCDIFDFKDGLIYEEYEFILG